MVWVFGGFDIAAKNEDAGKASYAIDERRIGPFLWLLEFAGRHG